MIQTDLLNAVAATSKRNEKIELLKGAVGATQTLLRYALDPMITFGLTLPDEPLPAAFRPTTANVAQWWDATIALADKLATRELTGMEAKAAVGHALMDAPTADLAMWAQRMFNKDLRANIGPGIALAALPGLFPEFKVFLANPYDPEKHELPEVAVFEPKLDGLRMVIIEGVAYTRGGHRITAVQPVIDAIPEQWRLAMVFDGEILGASFDETSGQVRQQKGAGKGLVYNIFDIVTIEEWRAQESVPILERKSARLDTFRHLISESPTMAEHLAVVPWALVERPTVEDMVRVRDEYLAAGYEGLMVKANVSYVWGRSNAMFKFKQMVDADGVITDYAPGKGKCKGKLGAFFIKVDGVTSKVGGGYTDAQRDDFWQRRLELVGKTIEVQYQNKTKDGKLRFPVFIKFRPDKD